MSDFEVYRTRFYGLEEVGIMTKELIINALLAGFWAGLAAFTTTQEFTTTALWAALVVAVRVAVGFIAAAVNKPIVVDQ